MEVPVTYDNKISKRGFASMSPERRLEIARKGGAAVPAEKRSFAQNKQLAQEAGRRGGSSGGARKDRSKEPN
jgi:general stress protein YciG